MDVSTCHLLVDLDSPPGGETELEPRYSADNGSWKSVYSERFLDSAHSHPIFRAFYLPWLSSTHNSFLDYHLLKRVTLGDKIEK